MEFITGLKQQEEAELEDLLKAEEGTTIILEGAVHSIRDMGEIAFVILRKRPYGKKERQIWNFLRSEREITSM